MVPRETQGNPSERLAENLAAIRRRIDDAARRAARPPEDVTLVVVTKGRPAADVALLAELGVREIGESRVQEAEPKIGALPDDLRWHLIGHLQRNKARRAVGLFTLIHSLESMRLLETLDRLGEEAGRPVQTLLQVNVSAEGQKFGIEPEEVREFLGLAASREGVRIRGLMGMAPYVAEPEVCRSCFSALARIRREADRGSWYRSPLAELSMGMTNDFEIAVEEGATMVRVGTAVFRGVDPSHAADGPPIRTEER